MSGRMSLIKQASQGDTQIPKRLIQRSVEVSDAMTDGLLSSRRDAK
jgi:hypothetical protein